jgi:hypothetical protein
MPLRIVRQGLFPLGTSSTSTIHYPPSTTSTSPPLPPRPSPPHPLTPHPLAPCPFAPLFFNLSAVPHAPLPLHFLAGATVSLLLFPIFLRCSLLEAAFTTAAVPPQTPGRAIKVPHPSPHGTRHTETRKRNTAQLSNGLNRQQRPGPPRPDRDRVAPHPPHSHPTALPFNLLT